MTMILKLFKIFDHLNVRDHTSVVNDICQGNGHLAYYELFGHNMNFVEQSQSGGAIPVEYGGEIFSFFKYHEPNAVIFNMYKNNDRDKMPECVIINVDKMRHVAYINGISYDNNCFSDKSLQKSGSTLLKVALLLIDKIKIHYKLKYVCLKDTSTKICPKSKTKINLWLLGMLTSGNTWYGRHNFLPFDQNKEDVDIEVLKKYAINQEIVSNTKVKDTKLKQIFKRGFEKMGRSTKKKSLDKFFKEFEDEYIVDFFTSFMDSFDSTCDVFSEIQKDVMKELKLDDLFGVIYYKKL